MQEKFTKIIFALSVLFFLFSAASFLFFRNMVLGKSNNLELAKEAWQAEAVRREEIKELDETLRSIQTERAKLETHFVRSRDVVPLLDTLESIAVSVGAKAEISSVDVAKDNTFLTVSIKASGTFAAVYKFLALLENSPYEMSFNTVDFRKSVVEEIDTGSNWNAIIQLKILSFLP